MNPTVLITDYVWPSIDAEKRILKEINANILIAPTSDESTLIKMATKADAIITCFAKVTENVIRAAKNCVSIGRFGVGVDNIDVSTASELGIPVTYVPDYCVDEVSDHVLAMLNTWNRKIALFDRSVKSDGWGHLGLTMRIKRLRGKTIGIVGFGRIGRAVAEKASVFGLKILASDPFTPKEIVESSGGKLVSLEELLENSDFVSLHAPLTTNTEKMIGPEQFDLMKDDAFLINAARGPLIDETALYEALSEGKIGGAGLDVMVDNEPSRDHPLMQLENILITPHTAFFSQESTLELEERAASEVVRVYRDTMPENLVNPEVLEHPNPRRSLKN